MPFTPTVSGHARQVLELGLEWLYNTVQPAEAIVTHHGISSCLTGNRRFSFSFIPDVSFSFIPDGGPNADVAPVLVVHVHNPVYLGDNLITRIDGRPEMDLWQQTIEGLGFAVTKRWNGEGDSGSFALAGRAHPTLLAALGRYRAGCLAHPEKSMFCRCGWLREGEQSLVTPTWPVDPMTAFLEDPPPGPNSGADYARMFHAGAHNSGAAARAAVHLLLATGIPLVPLFDKKWAEVSTRPGPAGPEMVAYITDWYHVQERHGDGSIGKLLKIAEAFAKGGNLFSLVSATTGLDVDHAKAVADAMLIATGVDAWFTVEPTPAHPGKLREA